MENRKFSKDKISIDTSAYHTIHGKFEAERFDGLPPLDTRVELEIPAFAITWSKRQELMDELAKVIARGLPYEQ